LCKLRDEIPSDFTCHTFNIAVRIEFSPFNDSLGRNNILFRGIY
jgi:hypothetical protein